MGFDDARNAVQEIAQIAEERAQYLGKYGEERKVENQNNMTLVDVDFPEKEPELSLLDRVNDFLKGGDSDERKMTIQQIAEKVGCS